MLSHARRTALRLSCRRQRHFSSAPASAAAKPTRTSSSSSSTSSSTSNSSSTSSASKKAPVYEPDFSITPTTYAYQLPLPQEPESHIRVSASPVSMVFEITGVPTSTTNHATNLESFDNYPLTTSRKLSSQYAALQARQRKLGASGAQKLNFKIEKPKNLKMTTKDFIDDSLYNPSYGYFNKDVEIFNISSEPFEDYSKIKSVDDFMEQWAQKYSKYSSAAGGTAGGSGQQLWHTPTELFQPYYGEAVARFLVAKFRAKQQRNQLDRLVIYEMGAGNGTLMRNVLDYIAKHHPQVYGVTEYRIIEISSKLFRKQQQTAQESERQGVGKHGSKVTIINKDIFRWDEVVEDEVFFLAFEVFDNFAHDVLKYNIHSMLPYQGYVAIDKHNEFREYFSPQLDKWTRLYLQHRERTEYHRASQSGRSVLSRAANPKSPLDELPQWNELKNYFWPFRNKLTASSEFIPTKLLEFFYVLKRYFPRHTLLSTDFSSLPGALPQSYNGPVVQTLFKQSDPHSAAQTVLAKPRQQQQQQQQQQQHDPASGTPEEPRELSEKERKRREYRVNYIPRDRMVTASTYMVNQGYFDIMFPTNFALMSEIYSQVTGRPARHESHAAFLQQWADVEKTRCVNGENPMLEFYRNVEFMYTEHPDPES